MKKYPSGFVPVNFQKVGKILLVIGALCLLFGLGSYVFDALSVSYLMYFGICSIAIGLYMIFVVPK